ncbi:uncharacterized protein OCT59_024604 [Rhizophagus irregularis]|uniref:uncharacterized protein n=1 Tax=Rhizophagus irregularis TaxID=588596 RepID=UPI001C141C2F|nr:hypothetical protein OCT59_024604 [Rhizophagus irregularis]CAB5114273.1 unnamed protein product [Rhizophagus irregularis]
MPTRFPSKHHCETCHKITRTASKQGHCVNHEWVCGNPAHQGRKWVMRRRPYTTHLLDPTPLISVALVMRWDQKCYECERLFKCFECDRNKHSREVEEIDDN